MASLELLVVDDAFQWDVRDRDVPHYRQSQFPSHRDIAAAVDDSIVQVVEYP